jgi:predicted hydrolase (HD superfamily)
MRAAVDGYGEGDSDPTLWGNTGMLHDADYDRWPLEHPHRIVAWLRDRGESDMAHAISAHYTQWGVPHESALDKALLACDELTGFIMACCYVRPEGIRTLTPKSVKKKLKDKRFAASVERGEVTAGLSALDVDPTTHIQFIIDALKPYAEELGIAGR